MCGSQLPPIPPAGRLAGVDYGTVRVGIAVCDPERTLASPYEQYTRRSPQADAEYFQRLARDERLVGWIVGLPVLASGDETAKAHEARAFGQWLGQTTGLPVAWFDERYTTSLADQWLTGAGLTKQRRKERRDKLAAQILLSAYLESGGRGGEGTAPLEG